SHLTDDILHKTPEPPTKLRKGVPARFEAIVLKCLEKEAEKRYQSAQELRAALEEFAIRTASGGLATVPRKRTPWVAAAVVVIGLIVVGAVLVAAKGRWRTWLGAGSRTPRIESLAVLPLTNLTGDAQQDFFVDGVTDELTTELAQIGALRVTSRTSATQAKGMNKSLPQLAQ